jgi:gluconokinase
VATVLALDVGSSSVRAQRFDEHAKPVDGLRQERYAGDDPDEIVRLVRAAVGGRDAGADAVGCSSFGHSLVALDAAGRPLTPLLGWRDTRSAAAAIRLRERVDPAAVRARTGAYLHPSFWPAKLAWLAEAEPEVFRSAARFVSFADYLYAQLHEAEPASSSSMASGTGLLDLSTGSWDAELLDVLGVDEGRLPAISNEPQHGWYPAVIDGACSNLGAGCTGPARAALMIGTSGALRILHEAKRPEPRPGLFLYVLDGRRVVEGGALSDGGNLYAWLDATLRDASGSVLERGPDEHGLAFLPLLGGERSTGWNPGATGAIDGLTFATTSRDIRQAALEGVGFRFAEIVDRLPEIEEIVATGGGLHSDPDWIQLLADALARPITASGVEEASLRGAAVATLERLGREAPPAPLGRVFHPRPERADAYRSARERHQRLYDMLYGDD